MDDLESSDQLKLPSQNPRPLFKMSGPWYGTRRQWLVMLAVGCLLSIPILLQKAHFRFHELCAEYLELPQCETWLGFQYERGLGVPQNYAVALKWYELAANRNYTLAQFNVGVMYRDGLGTSVNHNLASEHFLSAARKGFAPAMHSLGLQYQHGDGVPKDLVEAYVWMRPAADKGYRRAIRSIAILQTLMKGSELTEAQRRADTEELPEVELPVNNGD